jgi:hypothetical protein
MRTDRVQPFDQPDMAANCGMDVLPICQFSREYSDFTMPSSKCGS